LEITLRLFRVACQPVCNGQVTANETLQAFFEKPIFRPLAKDTDPPEGLDER
jgi:hypothetical protein